ncbi:HAMP domain-containing sensor histidine kinase [Massilia sp. TS11]|uniref:sensor histidine kinase n=1 Tax=Massilia sp. TS11 TaxID=2908003 RepID=UPI001EDA5431|nr:HAMP domain-containing sensor histidine kinase [Massilia sp. TS11]MCG2582806.1 HAMP domain-containing histidine kinase [Massilia sp. TS11]
MPTTAISDPSDPWLRPMQRFARGWLYSTHRHGDVTMRLMALAWVAVIGMPLYFLVWTMWFPQPYENLGLRLTGVLICLPALFLRERMPARLLAPYLFLGLCFELPFFFTFMYLMNGASPVWSQSLLIALIVLFHFPTAMALGAYLLGTAAAALLAWSLAPDAPLFSSAVLAQWPVHVFTIVVISLAKVGRRVLEQEKLAGMAQGLATVSHELRTPLASVEANARGLTRQLQHPALERIQFEVRHMNQLIELFLLSASAIERRPADTETVSVRAALEAMLERYPFTGEEQRAAVAIQIRHELQFHGQQELCVVVLLNLLRNAFKAIRRAGKGRVRVIVDKRRLLFIDTGCGIGPDALPVIFDRFVSFPAGSGSGIGLALCRDILHAWHARIRCLSRAGAYTIMVIDFPE